MKNDLHEKHKWTLKNAPLLDTNDWEVAYIGGVGGGGGVGAGSLFFAIRSPSLEQYLKFVFIGGGAGAGLIGGWSDQHTVEFDCSRASWVPMLSAIPEPFSASNLCNAYGRVSLLSIGTPGKIGWGYTKAIITAIYNGPMRQGYLFDKFEFGGTGFGTGGLGAGVFWGEWVYFGPPEIREMNNNWTKPVCRN